MREWTNDQLNAINARGGTILVSAAAGSGKTAVLVERIITKIKNNEVNADKFIVVTFTKAAAQEMRERINDAIDQLAMPGMEKNHYYQKQKILLERSKISTIHSFCSDLIRENFHSLSISPNFRVAQENEVIMLQEEALETVLDKMYFVAQNKEDKSELTVALRIIAEMFSGEKNDKNFKDTILKLYKFVRSTAFPNDWLDEKLSYYEKFKTVDEDTIQSDSIEESDWYKTISQYSKKVVTSYYEKFLSIIKELEKCEDEDRIKQPYLETFNKDKIALSDIINSLNKNSYTEVCKTINTTSEDLKSSLKIISAGIINTELKPLATETLKSMQKEFENISKFFSKNKSEVVKQINKQYYIVKSLFTIVKDFSAEVDRLKAEKNILDFSDLEQFAIKLLVTKDEDGNIVKTPEAIDLSKQYQEVMVDEYQDTNEAQNMIFWAISDDYKNLFMVGDVKQSIYRFRQAMPEIFIEKRNQFPKYDFSNNQDTAKIILGKNFRSRKDITESINFIFEQVMSEEIGEIDYDNDEALTAGAKYDESKAPYVKLKMINADIKNDSDDDLTKFKIEGEDIAKQIREMIDSKMQVQDGDNTRDITYKDIAILLRSTKNSIDEYIEQLTNYSIPVYGVNNTNYFDNYEIRLALNFLRAIDNPTRDISMVSILTSDVYGFTSDDLAQIRIAKPKGSIYLAISQLYKETNNQKYKTVLDDIINFRDISVTMPTNRFMQYLFTNKNIFSLIKTKTNPEIRIANLRLLIEYAGEYESLGYKGITGFVRYIDKIIKSENNIDGASVKSDNANVVKIMTIHNSKGLEFPVVFLANCTGKYNTIDLNQKMLIHPKSGIGIKHYYSDYRMISNTLPYDSVRINMKDAMLSEELRVLYVALTRAKERLIFMLTDKKIKESIKKASYNIKSNNGKVAIDPLVIRNCNSYADIILHCALRHEDMKPTLIKADVHDIDSIDCCKWDIEMVNYQSQDTQEIAPIEKNTNYNKDDVEQIERVINYKYPHSEMVNIPVKVGAKEVSEKAEFLKRFDLPNFDEKTGLSATQKGDALHHFMQYANFKMAKQNLNGELDRLVKNNYISQLERDSLNIESLNIIFQKSELMQRMLNAEQNNLLYREYWFMINEKAGNIYDNLTEEAAKTEVVVQGIADCIFEENSKMIVVDYKTDKVNNMEVLVQRYKGQLDLYGKAIEQAFEKEVSQKYIYSMTLNDMILVE